MMRKDYPLLLIVFAILIISLLPGCRGNGGLPDEMATVKIPNGLLPVKEIKTDRSGNQLRGPIGVTVDNNGNLYIVDSGNNRLLKFDSDYIPLREAGGYGNAEGLLNNPTFITLDNNLNLYISDTGNRRLSVFDVKLNYVGQVDLIDPDDPLRFGRPAGLAINDYGELWVADPDNSQVMVFNIYLSFDRMVGDAESYSGLMLRPADIARGPNSNMYITDEGRGSVFGFNTSGVFLFEYKDDQLRQATGIAVDRSGCCWVVDTENSRLEFFDRNGHLLYSEGMRGTGGDYGFNRPTGVAVLPDDRIAFCDTGNNRVMIYRILYPE
nr:NHL repeat-containing protein [candidate division Zixibacteria bacterium]